MKHHQASGLVLIGSSLGFVAVFSYLAASFGYPDVLDGSAAEVLPAFVAGGAKLRWTWAVYAALPAGLALSALLAAPLLQEGGETKARIGRAAALLAALAMTAGLIRWPTLHHALGIRFMKAGVEERQLLATLFDASNLYLGNVTGEFIGEIALSVWFLTTSLAVLRGIGLRRWLGYLGLVTAVSMTIGAFRNVTSLVDPIAAFNNSLLPLWLVIWGTALLLRRGPSPATSGQRCKEKPGGRQTKGGAPRGLGCFPRGAVSAHQLVDEVLRVQASPEDDV
jgi:hypothetical protein